jgi:hypothetical protein
VKLTDLAKLTEQQFEDSLLAGRISFSASCGEIFHKKYNASNKNAIEYHRINGNSIENDF